MTVDLRSACAGGDDAAGRPAGAPPVRHLHARAGLDDGCELRFADEQQGGVTLEVPTQGDVRVATPSAGIGEARSRGRLVSLTDGREYAVPSEGLTLGRDAGCDVVVAAANVSRRHARPVDQDAVGAGVDQLVAPGPRRDARVQGALGLARVLVLEIGHAFG